MYYVYSKGKTYRSGQKKRWLTEIFYTCTGTAVQRKHKSKLGVTVRNEFQYDFFQTPQYIA